MQDHRLRPALKNLNDKIANYTLTDRGCHQVNDFTADTRPVLDKKFKATFKEICPDGPERFSPYVIAMAEAGKLIPTNKPPSYPQELRKVKQKRSASAATDNEKNATWVASHLCHNRQCVNPDHLTWEPSWMNRLRDNCLVVTPASIDHTTA